MALRTLKKSDPFVSQIGEAVRFLEVGGDVAKSFTDSLAAGGFIVEDVQKVAAAVAGVLNCGLTREALLLLIQAKCPRPHGRPMPTSTIDDVLTALSHIDQHVVKK